MKPFLKNHVNIAGIVLLTVWLSFSVCCIFTSVRNMDELEHDLSNETELAGIIDDTEEFVGENVPLRRQIVEAYGLFQKAMGKHELNNMDVIRDKLGYLHKGNFFAGFGDDQRKIAINFRRLKDFAAQNGAKCGVVITPMKVAPEEARYIGLPYNSYYSEADTLLAWLRHYNVSCLDLRDIPGKSGLEYEQSFYKTDHHWTTPAAFEGYMSIVSWLEENEGLTLDPEGITRNAWNYSVWNYPSAMFGSLGRKAGLLFSDGTEDFSIYYPVSDGDYTLRFWDRNSSGEYSGGFRGALVDDGFVDEVQSKLFTESCYDLSFLYGLHSKCTVENRNNPDGVRVLVLHDSYFSAVGCYLAQNVSRMDMVYILGDHMREALEMIEENNYDYVLVCIYPENLAVENCRLFEDLDYA